MASLHFIIKNRGHVESRRLDLSKFDARQTNKRTRTISPPPPHLLSGMTPSRLRLRKASVRPSWFAFVEPFFSSFAYFPHLVFASLSPSLDVKALFLLGGGGGCMRQTTPKCKGLIAVWFAHCISAYKPGVKSSCRSETQPPSLNLFIFLRHTRSAAHLRRRRMFLLSFLSCLTSTHPPGLQQVGRILPVLPLGSDGWLAGWLPT